jgi:predicted RNase H-like nuclease (RuvC/YqgF family)
MNAVMRKYAVTEAEDMSADERSHLEIQVAELRADVRHVQSDTTEIKAELRATTTEIKAELHATTTEIKAELHATTTEIKTELRATNQRMDDLKDSLASAKIWALGLYVALSGSMFYVMARGFKSL